MIGTKKLLFLIWVCLIISIGPLSCVRYLEQQTPPAAVPPASPDSPESIHERNEALEKTKTQTSVDNHYSSSRSKQVTSGLENFQITGFANTYKRMGSPSIMIFLNRELSANVISWESYQRTSISGQETEIQKGHQAHDKNTSWEAEIRSDYRKSYSERLSPDESWTWAFEEGLYNTFFKAGVNLIDRDLSIRKSAIEYPNSYADAIEMQALDQNAEILIELLISRDPSSRMGYEFKAIGKSIKDSQILFLTTSLNWEHELSLSQDEFVATDQGYQIEEVSTIPPVGDIAEYLATDILIELQQKWEYR